MGRLGKAHNGWSFIREDQGRVRWMHVFSNLQDALAFTSDLEVFGVQGTNELVN